MENRKTSKTFRCGNSGGKADSGRALLAAISILGVSLGVAKGTPQDGKMLVAENVKVGADHITRKHIGNVKYEDITTTRSVQSKGKSGGASSSTGPGRRY